VTVDETGTAVFSASAVKKIDGRVLYAGKDTKYLSGANNSVTLTVGAAELRGGAIQGQPLVLANVVSTFSAGMNSPHGIATDGTNLYIADTDDNNIKSIEISTGLETLVAGSAEGAAGYADGSGADARFAGPWGITVDGASLYVADTGNNNIRRIELASGAVTTMAGSEAGGEDGKGYADGPAADARFSGPWGIVCLGTSLFVVDTGNHNVRQIALPSCEVSTLAGSATGAYGYQDEVGGSALFCYPIGIACDGPNLYLADQGDSNIRKIEIASRAVTTIAGSAAGPGSFGYMDGIGTATMFYGPVGLTSDGANLFVADAGNNAIRKIQ